MPRPSALAAPLTRWFARHARDLPWRHDRTPYRVWVSEVMLQQTQVDTVLRYYDRFLSRFPTARALAAAPEEDVLAAWSGLGFYRRARNLHRAAQVVAERFDGEVPTDADDLASLPGVGRYTVGAVLSLSRGRRLPILDGNVGRVLARVFRVPGDPKASATRKELWRLAEAVLPRERVGTFNEALMELGALVCRPKSPDCPACPLRQVCEALAAGDAGAYPTPARQKAVPEVQRVSVHLLRPDGRFALAQRPASGLLASLWELPSAEVAGSTEAEVARRVARRWGCRATLDRRGDAEHRFSHRLWRIAVFAARTRSQRTAAGGRWVLPEELGDLGVPTATRRALKIVAEGP